MASEHWAHKEPPAEDHPVDPHYNGNGLPAFWTCHAKVGKERCDGALLMDGKAPPITTPPVKTTKPESKMSQQP